MSNHNSDHYFLKGGGEMGALIRAKDWSKTPLGDPAGWPQSLQTMVAMMLDNPFGMYIAWGNEYTQLYNDGYRPILGANKHPQALGISTRETFSEIWHIIESMFEGVMNGKAVGFPDFMLPLNRNGFVEECYFDFSYSPIRKDDGEVGGVLVTVIETTTKKNSEEALKESEARFRAIADDAPVFIFLAGENAEVEYLNKTWREYTGISINDSKGRAWAEITHKDDIDPATKVYMDGFNKRESCSFENRQKGTDGIYRTILWKATPRFSVNGQFIGMMGVGLDIHERKKSEEKLQESEEKVRAIVENAPFPIGVFTGPEMKIELANESIIKAWGKGSDVKGKLFKELIPEVESQEIFDQIDTVFATGIPYHAYNKYLKILIDGKEQPYYYNYSFTPLFDSSGKVYGVMNTASDVTDLNLAKKKIEESDKRFRNTVKQAPVGITILRGPEYLVEMANEVYLALVDREESAIVGRPLFDALPEVKDAVSSLLDNVLNTGIPFRGNEVPIPLNRSGSIGTYYFDFLYAPLKEDDGKISGIIVTVTEVSEKVEARKKIEDSEKRYNLMLMQSPFAFLILKGKDMVVHLANDSMKEVLGKGQDIEGKPLLEVIPEIKGQAFPDLLDNVYNTGIPFSANEMVAKLIRNGKLEDVYFNYVYQPYYEADKTISGVTVIAYDVTSSVNANKKILENEQRFRLAIAGSNQIVFSQDRNLKHTWIYNTHPDFKAEDIIGKTDADMHSPTSAAILTGIKQKVINTGIAFNGDLEIEIGGQKVNYTMHIEAIKDSDGNITGIIGTATDISERIKAQLKIKESESKFRLLADSMPQHIWTSDPEGNLNYYNKSVFDYSGLTLEQINKDGWIQIVHPDDKEENIKQWINAVSTGKDFLFEHRFRRHDGKYRWQLSRAIPQKDETGKIQMWVGTSTDIEDQKTFAKELEEKVITRTAELKASEEKFYKLFNLSPISKTLSDISTGKIVMVNDAFTKLLGYSREMVIGRSSDELELLDLEERENLINELKTRGKIENREIWFNKKSGEKFIALASAEIIRIGNKQFFLSAFSDISEIKKAEQNIKQKNIELKKMNDELESFAYISSHDLQEPLRKIQTFASRIVEKEEVNLSEYGKDLFNRMQDAAKRMQTLIQDLLAYSRTNETERKLESMDLNKIISEVKEDLKEELLEKNATVEVSQLCHAEIIPFQFRQLMHNLIGNSLKFSNPGQPPHIKIESSVGKGIKFNNEKLSPQKKYCHISVSDNGIGFEPQYREKIFEVFQRLHGKNEYNGTGIGLSIVKKIIDNHNGIITANGELNKGATFDIFIPAK